jgi:hypothetical protein
MRSLPVVHRFALFVEGQTEQEFCDKLILAIAGQKARIEKRKLSGGATTRRRTQMIEAVAPDTGQRYYVLIVDCGGDESVKSRIVEEYDGLVRTGYRSIVGLRDVYPIVRTEVEKLAKGLSYKVKTSPVQVVFVLAIMETEAWFIAEHTHLAKVDPRLTPEFVESHLGFNPNRDDMQLLDNPAADLQRIYSLVGRSYSKKRDRINELVGRLDYLRIYLDLPIKYAPLRTLVASIDAFLAFTD